MASFHSLVSKTKNTRLFKKLSLYNPSANSPLTFQLGDWKEALVQTKNALKNKQLGLLSAGIAYFGTLAFFPLLAAAVAISAYFINPHELQSITMTIQKYLPSDIGSLVSMQLKNAAGKHTANTIVAIVAILISLFSVSGAVQNTIRATNVTYEQEETRKFVRLRLVSLLFTAGLIVVGAIIIALIILNSEFLERFGIPEWGAFIILAIRWILIVAIVAVSLAMFYRYGPDHERPKWQWVSWGALIATGIWLLGTIVFFIYAQYFSNFSKTYSLFAGIIVLMTWLNLSALIILIGAQINHSLELRTRRKTRAK